MADYPPFAAEVRYIGAAGQPAFASNWVNYGNGFQPALFYRDSSGVVHIEGTITNAAAMLAGAAVLTLPAGYRPSKALILTTWDNVAIAVVELRIDINGNLTLTAAQAVISHIYALDLAFRAV